jgi:hypothetical protein
MSLVADERRDWVEPISDGDAEFGIAEGWVEVLATPLQTDSLVVARCRLPSEV